MRVHNDIHLGYLRCHVLKLSGDVMLLSCAWRVPMLAVVVLSVSVKLLKTAELAANALPKLATVSEYWASVRMQYPCGYDCHTQGSRWWSPFPGGGHIVPARTIQECAHVIFLNW